MYIIKCSLFTLIRLFLNFVIDNIKIMIVFIHFSEIYLGGTKGNYVLVPNQSEKCNNNPNFDLIYNNIQKEIYLRINGTFDYI